jgi:hypothetical protein
MEGFQFKVAQDISEFESAYRLVHDEYVRCGYMDPNQIGMRFGVHNFLPESTTFIGSCDGLIALTISLFQDTDIGLPMDSIFKEEIDRFRSQGRKVAEVGALASHPKFRNGNQNIPMYGDKIAYLYARDHLEVDDLVIAVNPRHEWIYQHILLLEKIGERSSYDYVNGAAAVGYRLDLSTFEDNLKKAYETFPAASNLYAFFVQHQTKNIELPPKGVNCVSNRNVVKHFLARDPNWLDALDEDALDVFSRYWYLLAADTEFDPLDSDEAPSALDEAHPFLLEAATLRS